MYQKSEKTQALFEALCKAQAEFKPLHKSRTAKVRMKSGGEYSYKYADLSDLLAMVTPVLSKHGLVIVQPVSAIDGQIVITTELIHSSGELLSTDFSLPNVATGNMNAVQQIGSVITYGRRYALSSLLGIASEEDTDGKGGEKQDKRYALSSLLGIASEEDTDGKGGEKQDKTGKQGQAGNTTGGQSDQGDYQKLRKEFTEILKGFTEKEQKQAESMASKISPKDTKSMANLIKVWKLKKPGVAPDAQEAVQKVLGDEKLPDDEADKVSYGFNDDIPF